MSSNTVTFAPGTVFAPSPQPTTNTNAPANHEQAGHPATNPAANPNPDHPAPFGPLKRRADQCFTQHQARRNSKKQKLDQRAIETVDEDEDSSASGKAWGGFSNHLLDGTSVFVNGEMCVFLYGSGCNALIAAVQPTQDIQLGDSRGANNLEMSIYAVI
ncbi:hypothetical protein FRC12_019923 [Ceratobasidium sp. 428]|nr:hypothetical protein FRC09_006541 [Ceratobasidium sp. 395]KAG8794930.1 hypothetical protein FRC12_019923 [Ceratobasidium sp. 428]